MHIFQYPSRIICLVTLVFALVLTTVRVAVSQSNDLFMLTSKGYLYKIDKNSPSTSSTKFIRTVQPPTSGSYTFRGLIRKDGHFYTTFGVPTKIVRFGFSPGDEVVVGTLSYYAPGLAATSNGTVWIVYPGSNDGTTNSQIRTLDLASMSLGTPVTPSPQFFYHYNSGYWHPVSMTFDSSDRLIVWPDIFSSNSGYARFNDLTSGTWKKDCNPPPNGNSDPWPCWYSPMASALATDPGTGIIYMLSGGATGTGIFTLNMPSDSGVARQNISTQIGAVISGNDSSTIGLGYGLAFGPSPCHYYEISTGVTVCL